MPGPVDKLAARQYVVLTRLVEVASSLPEWRRLIVYLRCPTYLPGIFGLKRMVHSAILSEPQLALDIKEDQARSASVVGHHGVIIDGENGT